MTQVHSTRFADDVEFYAPGYLAMEAEGRAAEYDFELLLRRFINWGPEVMIYGYHSVE